MLSAPLAAHMACEQAELNFSRIFRGQFTLSQSTELAIDGYQITELGDGWFLHHCHALPIARLTTPAGTFAGLLLGIAVDGDGVLVSDGYTLQGSFESFATQAAGRYVALDVSGVVYADPTGSMGVVYDANTRTVASTPLMCTNRPLIDNPRLDTDSIQRGGGTYALGFTCDAFLRSVMPNHRLHLGDFSLTRFWPTTDATFPAGDSEHVIAKMGQRLSDVIGAIAQGHQTLLPLSGGRDSRNIAAAAKPHLEHIDQSFTFVSNWQGKIDATVAEQVAQTLGIKHETFTSYIDAKQGRVTLHRPARMRQKRAFWMACGYVGTPNNDVLDGLTRKLPKGVLLRGNVMEILCANHWKRGLILDAAHPDGHDADYATERLAIQYDGGPETIAEFKPDYLAWKDTLPQGAQHLAYDFAFLESLLPGWQPKFYSNTLNFAVNPFNDRALIEGCLRLPVAERRANVYNDALLAHLAPELVDIPFTSDIKHARNSAA